MRSDLYPLLFDFVYKDYVWGGSRIPSLFDRPPRAGLCAESWEISARPEGMSSVVNGSLAGETLAALAARHGPALLGTGCQETGFPLLIKIIDAKQRLSLQVHPSERTAPLTGGEPKTEMWYVLDAEPGAKVFAGLATATDPDQFVDALRRQQAEPLLNQIPVARETAVFIPGGRVHAIDEGCLLLEIQQNSNTTFRVSDWGRLGTDGRPRALHIDQAIQTIDWDDVSPTATPLRQVWESGGNACLRILECPFFHVARLDLKKTFRMSSDGRSFHALFVVKGNVMIETGGHYEHLAPGRSCLVPAAVPDYSLTPVDEAAFVMLISVLRAV